MLLFRLFLAVGLVLVLGYTANTIAQHGLMGLSVFFDDIAKGDWPGQFNFDFMFMLLLSALWAAWRNHFSPGGFALSLGMLTLGFPFLSTYLLILSFQPGADMKTILLGERRAKG